MSYATRLLEHVFCLYFNTLHFNGGNVNMQGMFERIQTALLEKYLGVFMTRFLL